MKTKWGRWGGGKSDFHNLEPEYLKGRSRGHPTQTCRLSPIALATHQTHLRELDFDRGNRL
ncbi:MAG: hypothetical protein SWY16_09280 [Cyanobacteriota bacterium]|nr:hypothetical protein [Cyanobacteriota bacterium]